MLLSNEVNCWKYSIHAIRIRATPPQVYIRESPLSSGSVACQVIYPSSHRLNRGHHGRSAAPISSYWANSNTAQQLHYTGLEAT